MGHVCYINNICSMNRHRHNGCLKVRVCIYPICMHYTLDIMDMFKSLYCSVYIVNFVYYIYPYIMVHVFVLTFMITIYIYIYINKHFSKKNQNTTPLVKLPIQAGFSGFPLKTTRSWS